MKSILTFIFVTFCLSPQLLAEVTFSPAAVAESNVQQIRISFSEAMIQEEDAFTVKCDPELAGDGYWADNNTTWVYNFNLPKDEYGDPMPLPGGASCSVTQNQALESVTNTLYALGSLEHQFTVVGPKVTGVYLPPGLNNKLREEQPVMMITFDGDIKPETLYNSQQSYLSYVSSEGAPSEKILLQPVPAEEADKLFDAYSEDYSFRYQNITKDSKRWALVTTSRNLIQGAQVQLTIAGVESAYAGNALAPIAESTLQVRDSFKAEVSCSRNQNDSTYCMPEGGVSVALNARAKWSVVKDTYLEYVPQNSANGSTVRAYPNDESVIVDWLGWAASKLNLEVEDEATVTGLDFNNVKVAPNTQAKLVFPAGTVDTDGRELTTTDFTLAFGAFTETIRFAKNLSIMERLLPGNTSFPISIMNLNQKVTFSTSGASTWSPVTDMEKIIDLVVGYDSIPYSPDEYVSPLSEVDVPVSIVTTELTGTKNKNTVLSIPFAQDQQGTQSGLYVVEVKSDISEQTVPQYAMTLVTDLNLHAKIGEKETLVWLTSFSTGQVVPNALIEVYGCNKQVQLTGTTQADGSFRFSNESMPACEGSKSHLTQSGNYFIAARTGTDMAFINNTYTADNSWALYSPGVEYFYSDIVDYKPYFHAVVGVNLVKPGQTVPVQIIATMPTTDGFRSLDQSALPTSVEIRHNRNTEISYQFPLNWKNGTAELLWDVPKTTDLGSYSMYYTPEGQRWETAIGGDIEVAEFKIPLMTANMSLPEGPLVKPQSIPVSGTIQYANGVGAKDLEVSLSYYFSETSLSVEDYNRFGFARGAFSFDEKQKDSETDLPNSEKVATLEELSTENDGTVTFDLGTQTTPAGQSLIEALSQTKRPYNLVVRMRYQDQMGEFQTVSSSRKVYNASAYVGAAVTMGPRNEASLDVVKLGIDGKPYTNLSDLKVEVLAVNATVVGEELFGGLIQNVINYEIAPTSWTPQCATNEQGIARCAVGDLEMGSYVLQVSSQSLGQSTYARFTVDSEGVVQGENDYYYENQEEEKGLLLATDKADYEGGDTAKISFESPFATCTALITLERAEVIESRVDNQACANGFVTVPVSAEQAPNIFASVYLTTGRSGQAVSIDDMDLGKPTYRLGFANLKIDWSRYAADVQVSMDKKEYKPGETATVTVNVEAQRGVLLGSDVTFVIVEEKILEMKANETTNLLNAMMGLRTPTVSTANTYEFLESIAQVEAKALGEAAAVMDAKGGPEGGSGSEMEAFKRELFDALVAFETNVPVVNGQAQYQFKLNDSLTNFKVIAVVKDAANKFGSGSTTYLSKQEVQTYANMPPVARTGDKFPVTVTLQNNGKTADNLTVVVDYRMLGPNGALISEGTLTSTQTIDSASSKPVSVGQLEVPEAVSSIEYGVTVMNDSGIVDRLAPPVQSVYPSIPLSVQDEYLVQMENDSVDFVLKKSPQALPGQGQIQTEVFSSLVGSTLGTIKKDLSQDPFADFTVENRVITALVNSSASDMSALETVLIEMVSMLDDNGFVKYYPSAQRGDFWLTADLIQLIGTYDWAVQAIPSNLKNRWEQAMLSIGSAQADPEYVSSQANETAWFIARVKAANSLLALTSSAAPAAAQAAVDMAATVDVSTLPAVSVAEIAELYAAVQPEQLMQSTTMKYINESLLVVNDKTAMLDSLAGFNWWGYSDETIATARLVKALSEAALTTGAQSSDAYLDNLVAGLVNANKGGRWYNNRTKAWVLSAMTDFGRTYEAAPVSGQTVMTSTETAISNNVNWTGGDEENGIVTTWAKDEATLNVTHSGEGRPWVSVVASEAVKLEKANYKGIQVSKEITNKTRQDGTYQAGDMIEVVVTVSSNNPQRHVVLFDPIPSGANILADGWGQFSQAEKTYRGYKVYFNYLPGGENKVHYQYQLNNPGVFQVAPTRAEALYEPGFFGETPNQTMTVQ